MSQDQHDLDGALRRMLRDLDADDRLDVPVRPGATEAIVAGARRARRRRIAALAATGVLTAAAVVIGGVLAVGGPQALPPATSRQQVAPDPSAQSSDRGTTSPRVTTTRKSTSAETQPAGNVGPGNGVTEGGGGSGGTPVSKQPPPPAGELIGPTSWRSLHLGMSYDDAMATGLLAPGNPVPPSGCEIYQIMIGGQQRGFVRISAASGAEEIYPVVRLHTPEGATNGWTLAQVKAAYPDVDEAEVANSGNGYAAVPGNPGAVYRFEILDLLVGIALQGSATPCGG